MSGTLQRPKRLESIFAGYSVQPNCTYLREAQVSSVSSTFQDHQDLNIFFCTTFWNSCFSFYLSLSSLSCCFTYITCIFTNFELAHFRRNQLIRGYLIPMRIIRAIGIPSTKNLKNIFFICVQYLDFFKNNIFFGTFVFFSKRLELVEVYYEKIRFRHIVIVAMLHSLRIENDCIIILGLIFCEEMVN